MIIRVSDAWKTAYPKAHLGSLVMHDVVNPKRHSGLERQKEKLEAELRRRFVGYSQADLKEVPTMGAYQDYYRRFRKTYHVLLQLRSVALEGKPLPTVAALVEAMFMAEINNGLLTAGHDLDKVYSPITLDVAHGNEHYVMLNGREQIVKAGDMMMTDAQGVICTVIYGLDRRTAISPTTRRVIFVVYAPDGIDPDAVHEHLEEIRENVLLIAPQAVVEELHVYGNEP